jgi:Fe-S cluster assembly protein SufD
VHLSAPGDARSVSQPRTSIDVGARGNVAFIETYCGLPGPAFTDASTTLRVGPGARVTHIRVQAESPEADHLGRTVVHQAEASETHLTSVMTGADIARHETAVRLGADARVDLDGLYVPSRRQRHDNVVTVDHAASRATSTQHFRGAIDDHARGSFSGHVIVRGGTVGNDAQQTSRSLLLSPTAEADTRPWLEILADDVRCTHGATVGRLDEDALFYLRSRGISLADSRAMLVAGFVAEIIDTIEPASLRTRLATACARPMAEGQR